MSAGFNFSQLSQYFFGRVWSVALAPPGESAAAEYTTLRTQFDIDQGALGTSIKCKITLYGLSSDSRQKIVKGWNVQLKAGYSGLSDTLFIGTILPNGVSVKREGPDIITTMECGGGEPAIVLGTFDKSYPSPAQLNQITSDLVNQMVNLYGLTIGVVSGIPSVQYQNGYTAHGSIKEQLDKICKTNGLQWYVRNNQINIYPLTASNGSSLIQVNSQTGMIGLPSSDGGFMRFISLLNPGLVPGASIQLTSTENPSLNGIYAILRSHFEGDSHDNKWQVSCECKLTGKINPPSFGPTPVGVSTGPQRAAP